MLYILMALVIAGLDQLLKYWVIHNIALGGVTRFIPGIMSLTHLQNTGMAFSMLSDQTWLLGAISVVVVVIIAVLLVRKGFTKWEKVFLAFIMGGALGNAIDRVLSGYVVDMFRTDFIDFAVFNLADAFIDVGAVLFCVLFIIRTMREDKEKTGNMPEIERLKKNKASSEDADESDGNS